MCRREYSLDIVVNGLEIKKVIIDSHYELKHSDTVNDDIILNLVKQLDGERYEPQKGTGSYEYYMIDKMPLNGCFYKLIWLLEKGSFTLVS